jgi:hypothetical protein
VFKKLYPSHEFREDLGQKMETFDNDLEAANARMKRERYGVTIRRRGGTLYLRATLPPRPDSDKPKAHQQDIALGIYANPPGLKRAIADARKLSSDIALKRFEWSDWGVLPNLDRRTVGEWIKAYEAHYFTENERNGSSETTWHKDYRLPILKLPQDEPLTPDMLLAGINAKAPDSRSRKRFYDAYRRLAAFAGLDVDFGKLRGKYSASSVNHRDLPSDEDIALWRDRIPDQAWRWVFGVVAAYGLRSHEAFHIDLETIQKSPLIWVEKSKTVPHYAMPVPKRCWEEWRLFEVDMPFLPGDATNALLSNRVSQYFGRDLERAIGERMPFGMQTLRHCWSIRASEYGIEPEFAAKLQAHSERIHADTYQRHTDEKLFRRLLKKLSE